MIRERLAAYRGRIRRELLVAFREEHTPHQIAASFALGIFVTSLPTGGLGVGLFFVFAARWSWINKPAIFATVAVLNPFVKPVVYVVSFQVGAILHGNQSVASFQLLTDPNVELAGLAIRQLLVGNLLVGVVLSAIGYVLVLSLTRAHRRRENQQSGTTSASALLGLFRRQ